MKILSLILVLCLASCARNHATGGLNFSLVSEEKEREVGEATAHFFLKSDGLYRPASTATRYVSEICNKVFAVTEAAATPVQCNVLDSHVFNASATPGYIQIYRGFLPFISSEEELAHVIAHESGHLTARHTNKSLTQQIIAETLVTGAVASVAQSTNANYGAIRATSDIASMAGGLTLMAYNRSEETEADALARRYLELAGYDPRSSVTASRAALQAQSFFQSQQIAFNNGEIAPKSLLDTLKSSHPATEDRIQAALKATGEPPVLAPEADLGRQRYMAAINGLAYGPARRYGIARLHELVLPQQRVVIPLPAGTTTAYIGSGKYHSLGTWLVAHPQSGAYMQIASLKTLAGHNPGTYIKGVLPFLHGPLQRIMVGVEVSNTVPATEPDLTAEEDTESAEAAAIDAAYVTPQSIGYTATYHYLNSSKRFRIFAVSAPATVDEMLVFTIVYPNEDTLKREDDNLMSIIKNISFLTKRQAKRYKQLELFTFKADVGQTVAQQAAHLPVGAMQEELFRAMNNLPAGTDMQPGQLYKTIRDPNP